MSRMHRTRARARAQKRARLRCCGKTVANTRMGARKLKTRNCISSRSQRVTCVVHNLTTFRPCAAVCVSVPPSRPRSTWTWAWVMLSFPAIP